mgnify:CR=1 FL=1
MCQNKEFNIPQWQMNQVRERSEEYHKNPSIGLDFDEAMRILRPENEEKKKIIELYG